ncbi:diguanylate cyclase [Vibrio sp. TRT 17S01]|uniref:diguanylate cyclase n=1 Tax=Vibrio sp. TRT 17S01 TaxID=3418505 RepID=UPI003CF677B4
MIESISRKLTVLFISTAFLIVLITYSLGKLHYEQKRIQQNIQAVIQIQSRVNMLRSQLWVFLQYEDSNSLEQVYIAQQRLSEKLSESTSYQDYIANLDKLNESLAVLIEQERSLVESKQERQNFAEAKALLHSRYNMVVQNMTEELSYLEQHILKQSAERQAFALTSSAVQLLLFSIIVCGIAFMILKRFRQGVHFIRQAIDELGRGNLVSRMQCPLPNDEFVELAKYFNHMKQSLQNSIITKEELEQEIKRKTSTLELQKEQLVFLSERDPLTGLRNRRAFLRASEQAIMKANRTGLKIALFFIDLDRFKEINDNYGHDAGDEILRQFAFRIERSFRSTDFAGRWGGDEFVVCLDLLENYDGVMQKADEFVEYLKQPIDYEGQLLSVGASIGVSCFPGEGKDMNTLIKLADEAMYQAKRNNENHVFSYWLDNPTSNKIAG